MFIARDPAMLIVTAVVVALALSANGLAALAAATSRRHWFVRTAAYLAGLSLLLVIPAPELVATFALQGAIVAVGVSLWRRRRERRSAVAEQCDLPSAPPSAQFSLRTLLLITVLVGWAVAVGANTPPLNRYAWQSLVLAGATAGVATLLAAWAATRRGWRSWALSAPLLLVAAIVALPLASFDWLCRALVGMTAWPPDGLFAITTGFTYNADLDPMWLGIIPIVAHITWLTVATLPWTGWFAWSAGAGAAKRLTSRVVLVAVVAIVAAPLAWLWMHLAFPPAIPTAPTVSPNGWDELAKLGPVADQTALGSGTVEYDTATPAVLRAEVAKNASLIADIRRAIEQPLAVRLTYGDADIDMPHITQWRSMSRLLVGAARASAYDADYAAAVETLLDVQRLGIEGRRGGLLIQGLVGMAVTNQVNRQLWEMREQVPAPRQIATAILAALNDAEPFEAFATRDYVWEQHANGWCGRLHSILMDFCEADLELIMFSVPLNDEAMRDVWRRETAITRLLALQLLAEEFQQQHGRLPQTAEETIGELPLDDFIDPFSPDNELLQLTNQDGKLIFYSVGRNGIDDGGAEPQHESYDWWDDGTGDVRLDFLYRDRPEEDQNDDESGDIAAEESADGSDGN